MRLIDADAIDFSEIKDDFDRARAKIIIMGQPTLNADRRTLNHYEKAHIMNLFHKWCEENSKTHTLVSLLEYLNDIGMLIR